MNCLASCIREAAIIRSCILHNTFLIASFPGSPSFRAIIRQLTFDPHTEKQWSEVLNYCVGGEPGNEATLLTLHGRYEVSMR